MAWIRKADTIAVYADRGISEGMKRDIEHAESWGLKVSYRYLEPDHAALDDRDWYQTEPVQFNDKRAE